MTALNSRSFILIQNMQRFSLKYFLKEITANLIRKSTFARTRAFLIGNTVLISFRIRGDKHKKKENFENELRHNEF